MSFAYLMNTYPMTSTTFVRREIEAIERRGAKVQRIAIRRWRETLVDADDIAEVARTRYILSGNIAGLLAALVREIAFNPRGLAKGVRQTARLAAANGCPGIKHVAYLMQAVHLKQLAEDGDIAHVHAHFSTNAAAVAMLSRVMGGPSYSFTAHGPDEFYDGAPASLDAKLTHAAFAVAISSYCKSQLMRFGGTRHAGKIRVVRCGLDLRQFRIANGDADRGQTFVCVGRLCPQKGQALIPAAVAPLRSEFPDLRVVLIGDGEGRGEVERAIAAHGVEKHVELVGWRPNAEVRRMIEGSRALLLPSFAEGLPVVIMEALALGRPVISTYIAGIPELLDDTCGWIVPAGSVEQLTAALRAALLATPADLEAKGAEGRARVVARHDIDREAARLLGEMESAADGAPVQRPAVPAGACPSRG